MTHRCAHCTRHMPDDRKQRNCELCVSKGIARAMKSYRARREAGLCSVCLARWCRVWRLPKKTA